MLLAEGDSERWDAWSGITKSVVDHLRAIGHTVTTSDADLYGVERWTTALRSFSPTGRRWGVKYHLGGPGYRRRSKRAADAVAAATQRLDVILQVGATFAPPTADAPPYALFCDSNIVMAEEGVPYGVSDAAWLTAAERRQIRDRESRLYHGALVVFTISDYLRRSFINDFQLPPDRVVPVWAGPNLELSRIPARPTGTSDGPPTVLFVGKQFERKGGGMLLDAFARVRAALPAARLIVIGPPPRAAAPGVEWWGPLNKNVPDQWQKLVSAYAQADVFCLPSLFEPFGIVFLEAMFFGLPCVGTDAWAIPEMVVDSDSGFTVPRGDAVVLAERLLRLLTDRDRAAHMGRAGRARAEQMFTWAAVARRMTDALEARLGITVRA
jgi:glycosyltransferase involved in cell wall biosynthesis